MPRKSSESHDLQTRLLRFSKCRRQGKRQVHAVAVDLFNLQQEKGRDFQSYVSTHFNIDPDNATQLAKLASPEGWGFSPPLDTITLKEYRRGPKSSLRTLQRGFEEAVYHNDGNNQTVNDMIATCMVANQIPSEQDIFSLGQMVLECGDRGLVAKAVYEQTKTGAGLNIDEIRGRVRALHVVQSPEDRLPFLKAFFEGRALPNQQPAFTASPLALSSTQPPDKPHMCCEREMKIRTNGYTQKKFYGCRNWKVGGTGCTNTIDLPL